jgi:glycosyltransferase involved in cell wall biosynthesis
VKDPPLVGLDIRRATLWPQTGIARYGRNLFRSIQADPPPDMRVQAIDVDGRSAGLDALTVGRGTPAWRRAIQEQVSMAALSARLDLLHLPWSEGPVRPRCPLVFTLFDLVTIEDASSYGFGFRVYYNTLLRAHMRRAAAVIVSSQTTLDAARERWPDRRFHLIPLAVDPSFHLDAREPRTPEPTVLYTGGFDPRKRVADLLEAVARLQKRIPSVQLVVSGVPPPAFIDLARRKLERKVEFLGYVGDEVLASWYRRAWVVAYPTDAEGFGFPIVEAFASGTPVVAARAGSVEEVSQGAALLVSPGDVDELVDSIERLLSDRPLRESLAAEGLRRASTSSWDEVARMTIDVYRDVLVG